jgi:hypothetical protein
VIFKKKLSKRNQNFNLKMYTSFKSRMVKDLHIRRMAAVVGIHRIHHMAADTAIGKAVGIPHIRRMAAVVGILRIHHMAADMAIGRVGKAVDTAIGKAVDILHVHHKVAVAGILRIHHMVADETLHDVHDYRLQAYLILPP